MKNIDTSSKNIIEEMAILATITYMKYVVPTDDYIRFMELDDDDDLEDDIDDTTRIIHEINKSLYYIRCKDSKLLDDIVSKIKDIIDKANE